MDDRIFPIDVHAELREDGAYHYGLLFRLSDGKAKVAKKQSSLNTEYGGRWGRVESWFIEKPWESAPPGTWFLLIPRTWLIRNGFLPVGVALHRDTRADFLDEATLKKSFWLELPSGASL